MKRRRSGDHPNQFSCTVRKRQGKKGFIVRMCSHGKWPWFQASRVIDAPAEAGAVFDSFVGEVSP